MTKAVQSLSEVDRWIAKGHEEMREAERGGNVLYLN